MRLLILLIALLAVVKCRVLQKCSGVVIHGVIHDQEVLVPYVQSPFQLAIDFDTSYLFYSYNRLDDPNDTFRSGYINLKTNERGVIDGITGGFANAVDDKRHIVYLGGNDGIYKFDFETKKAIFLGEKGTSIWQLFYKDKLYFTQYPFEKAFTFENGVGKFIQELRGSKVKMLALDRMDNYLFSNKSGLYTYEKDKSKFTFLGDYDVNGFTTDINKNIYFSTTKGIYSIDENGPEVKKLAHIENVMGIAVEADNTIIYANDTSIIRLKPTKDKCLSDSDNNLLQ